MNVCDEPAVSGGRWARVIAYLVGLAAAAVLLWTFGFVGVWQRDIYTGDFSAIWAGPHVLVSGGDPYDPASWPRLVAALPVQRARTVVYLYPAWVALLLAPLGALDLPTADLVWTAIGVAAASAGLLLLLEASPGRHPLIHATLGFALLGSEPGIVAFYSGQTDLLVTGVLAGMAAAWRTERSVAAGIAAAIMLVKPQLFLLAIPAVIGVAVVRRDRRFLVAFGAVALAAVALSTVVLPGWWGAWAANVARPNIGEPSGASLPNALRDLAGGGGFALAWALLLLTLGAALRFSPRSWAALPIWLAASISVAPFLFVYNHIVEIVPLALAAQLRAERRLVTGIVVAVVGALILTVVATLLHATAGTAHGKLTLNGFSQFALTLWIFAALWDRRTAR